MLTYRHLFKNKNKIFSSIRKMFNKHPIIKFASVLILVVTYFLFATKSHGTKDGFIISILSWSFFVFCTPIADAGILIDFPIRLISGIKMIYSEMIVWVIAININFYTFFNNPSIYDKTILLSLFKHIISTPFPYWGIIILSAIGTFLSIHMGDNLVNFKKQKIRHQSLLTKYKIIVFIFLIVLIILLYNFLLHKLGIQIPLI